jgi:hypothetical protein
MFFEKLLRISVQETFHLFQKKIVGCGHLSVLYFQVDHCVPFMPIVRVSSAEAVA